MSDIVFPKDVVQHWYTNFIENKYFYCKNCDKLKQILKLDDYFAIVKMPSSQPIVKKLFPSAEKQGKYKKKLFNEYEQIDFWVLISASGIFAIHRKKSWK